MNILTVARFTLQEAISRRLVLAGAIISLIFLALFTVGFTYLYGMARESAARYNTSTAIVLAGALQTLLGLYAVYFLSSFLALFLSVGAISGEIDSGTLHAVLARPIRRAEFVLGRWLGYVALTGIYVGSMASALLLVARVVAGYEATDSTRAVALIALGSVTLLSLSLLGSALLSTLANGVVVFTLFGLAWMGGMMEFVGNTVYNESMINLGIAVSLLVPSDAIWRAASYYIQSPAFLAITGAGPGAIPFASASPPTDAFIVWSVLHPVALLLATVAVFSRRDL